MRDIKEKPGRPKVKNNAFKERRPAAKTDAAGRMGRLMKKRYLRERDKERQEQEPSAVISAEEQVEQSVEGAVSSARSAAAKGFIKTRQAVQAKRQAAKQDGQGAGHGDNSPYREAGHPTTAPEYGQSQGASEQRQPPSPGDRMKQAAIKEKKAQAIKERPAAIEQGAPLAGSVEHATAPPDARAQPMRSIRRAEPEAAQEAPVRLTAPDNPSGAPPAIREKPPNRGPAIKTRQAAQTVKRRNTVKEPVQAPAPPSAAKQAKAIRTTRAARTAKAKAAQTAQERGKQLAVSRARQAVQAAASVGKKAAQTIAHAAAALFHALIGAVGGMVLLVALCIIILVAAVVASPFGIFFADQQKEPGAISPSAAVAQINVEYAARLAELQEGDYDSIQIHGGPPDWRDVIAVFACKTAGADDGVDVTVFDDADFFCRDASLFI